MAYALGVIVGRIVVVFLLMLVIGGIYYLVRRPRVTFRHAIFRWWVVLISVVLVVMSVVSQTAQDLGLLATWS